MAPVVGVHGIWNYGYLSKGGGLLAAARQAIGQDWTGWLADGLGQHNPPSPRRRRCRSRTTPTA